MTSVTFSFGQSFASPLPVSALVRLNLPYTVELTVAYTLLGTLMAVPLGVAAAVRRGQGMDTAARLFALLGYAVPDFFLAAVLLIVFALDLGWFPVGTTAGVMRYGCLVAGRAPAMAATTRSRRSLDNAIGIGNLLAPPAQSIPPRCK